MKSIKQFIIAFVAIILVVIIGVANIGKPTDVKVKASSNSVIGKQSATATSTLQFLKTSDTASTTLTSRIEGANLASIQICTTASSSATRLDYSIWFSQQADSELASTTTWYVETNPAVSGAAVTVTQLVRSITPPATASTTCFDDLVTPLGAKQLMLKYSVAGANAGVWTSIAPNVQF